MLLSGVVRLRVEAAVAAIIDATFAAHIALLGQVVLEAHRVDLRSSSIAGEAVRVDQLLQLTSYRSVGAEVEFYYLLAVLPLVWLAGMIPISLNGLGITEAGYAIFLQLVGVTPEDALTVALLVRFRLLITALLGGLVFLRHRAERAE